MSWFAKIAFYSAFGIDCIALLLAVYFVFEDATRFAGHPKNGGSGLILATTVLGVWTAGTYLLFHHNQKSLAVILAWIPALPVLLYGLFILMFIVLKPDMK